LANPKYVTPVVFRKWPESEGGEVIALFPHERELDGSITSYQHTGQHGAASPDLVYRTKAATKAQYADLKRELEGIGFVQASSLEEAKQILRSQGLDPNQFWWSKQAPKSMKGRRGQSLRPNPAAGVEAIPSKWTSATVATKGKQVQLRIGGQR
jgi:hypothetical protein